MSTFSSQQPPSGVHFFRGRNSVKVFSREESGILCWRPVPNVTMTQKRRNVDSRKGTIWRGCQGRVDGLLWALCDRLWGRRWRRQACTTLCRPQEREKKENCHGLFFFPLICVSPNAFMCVIGSPLLATDSCLNTNSCLDTD